MYLCMNVCLALCVCVCEPRQPFEASVEPECVNIVCCAPLCVCAYASTLCAGIWNVVVVDQNAANNGQENGVVSAVSMYVWSGLAGETHYKRRLLLVCCACWSVGPRIKCHKACACVLSVEKKACTCVL